MHLDITLALERIVGFGSPTHEHQQQLFMGTADPAASLRCAFLGNQAGPSDRRCRGAKLQMRRSPQPRRRRTPPPGANPSPDEYSAVSAPATWFEDVPLSWRTPSITWVTPCRYTSARLPPCVLTGVDEPSSRFPSAAYGPASPTPQKPQSSSSSNTPIVVPS